MMSATRASSGVTTPSQRRSRLETAAATITTAAAGMTTSVRCTSRMWAGRPLTVVGPRAATALRLCMGPPRSRDGLCCGASTRGHRLSDGAVGDGAGSVAAAPGGAAGRGGHGAAVGGDDGPEAAVDVQVLTLGLAGLGVTRV